ncbi:hypothetical protein DSO57_1024440 [Entomophthora muscae]|uniref:Uncharacterized protein n=1 Tax=Entomophthora muscae TaxID=34485 RepID=A0ACC2UNC4_9FUNG|nr:hypothetical protein DSO57_1024440 [Entomophthora muscae]
MHDYRRDYSQGFYCEMRELYNRNQTYSSVELKDFLDFENEDSADETEYNPPPMVSPPTPQPSSHSKPALSPVVITISSSPLALSDSTPAPLISKEENVCSSIKKEALPETENKKLSQEPILSSPAQKALSTKDTPSTDMKAAVKGEKSNKETNPKVTGLTNKIESKVVNSYSNKTEKPKETKEAAFLRDLRLYCKKSLLKYGNADKKFSDFPNSFKKFILGMLIEYPNIYTDTLIKIRLAGMVVRRFLEKSDVGD